MSDKTTLLDEETLAELADPSARAGRTMPERLWRSRELIFTLVKRDLKVRYKSTALGFLWSFGRPLFLMIVIAAVFSVLGGIGASHQMLPYPLHVLTGILPWFFFAASLQDSTHSILGNSNVVKKVWLPTEVFPATAVLGQFVHFVLTLPLLGAFVLAFAALKDIPEGLPGAGDPLGLWLAPDWSVLLLPFVVLVQAMFTFAIALILASLNVFYRDVGSIAEIVISAWFYITPIIYPANQIRELLQGGFGEWVYYSYLINPMTPVVLAYRRLLFGRIFSGAPEVSDSTIALGMGVTCLTTIVLMGIGMAVFNRTCRRFADEL